MRSAIVYAKEVLIRLHREELGQDMVEYGLIAALVALGALTGMSTLANYINNAFSTIGVKLSSSVG